MVQHPHVISAGGAWGRDTLCWVGGDLSVIKHAWLVACPGSWILPCVCPEEARGEEEGDASAAFIWLLAVLSLLVLTLIHGYFSGIFF